jgi:hypothetical protein
MVQKCSKGSKMGAQGPPNWSQKRQKGVPITRPRSYGTLWAPIGGPGIILDGFGVDFGGILGRLFRGFWSTFFVYFGCAFPAVCLVVLQVSSVSLLFFLIRHHALRHFPVLYVPTGMYIPESVYQTLEVRLEGSPLGVVPREKAPYPSDS